MEVVVDPGWATGLALSSTRVAAFAVASPIYGRVVPLPGRIALVLVLGFFLTDSVPTPDLGTLVGAGIANALVGAALGFLTGLLFYVFQVAGGLLDFSSGLSVSGVLDPMTGQREAIYGRTFGLVAGALFLALRGDQMLVAGLTRSVEAVPLVGMPSLDAGLAEMSVDLVGKMMLASVELAFPALAALFLVELAMGLATRMVPQINAFLVGLPAKILVSLLLVSLVALAAPSLMGGVMTEIWGVFSDAVAGMSVG